MAKIIKGILGEVSGLVGTVVGAVVRGEPTIRSRPRKSTKPAKPSQINQRSKFALATEFMASLRRVVDLGFRAYSTKMSPTNVAVQDLLDHAIIGQAPDYLIDYPNVKLSKGSLLPDSPTMTAVAKPTDSTVDFAWDMAYEISPTQQDDFKNDLLTVVFYSPARDRFVTYVECATRLLNARSIMVPPIYAGNPLHVWVFFSTPNGAKASDTQYLGTVTPLA